MKKDNLIIIADDLGIHASINEGIQNLFERGAITGASLVVNGDAFDDAIKKCSKFNLGLHLTLVEEKPIANNVNSLINKKGYLHENHKIFFIKYILGMIKKNEIENELRAQIEKAIRAGVKPAFINGHQHIHLLPGIMNVIVELAEEYNIPYIRLVHEPFNLFSGNLFRQSQLIFLNLLSNINKNKIKKSGLKTNDFFVGFINAGKLNKEDIDYANLLSYKYGNKLIELGCHPGLEDDNLKTTYKHWGDYNWHHEFNLLINYN